MALQEVVFLYKENTLCSGLLHSVIVNLHSDLLSTSAAVNVIRVNEIMR